MKPFKTTKYDLDKYKHVAVTKEIRRSKNSTYTVYPVKMAGDAKEIEFGEPRNYEEARRQAEEVARFVQLDLVDSTSGQRVRRSPQELDESLRDRARRTGVAVEMPERPAFMKTETRIEGRRIILDLPRKGLKVQHIVMPFVGLVILCLIGLWFLLVVAVPVLLVFGAIMAALRSRVRLVASGDGLQYQKRGLIFTKTIFIPTDELEELILPSLKREDDVAEAIHTAGMPEVVKGIVTLMARASRGRCGSSGPHVGSTTRIRRRFLTL